MTIFNMIALFPMAKEALIYLSEYEALLKRGKTEH